MRRIVVGLVALTASIAVAQADPLSGLYGNTVTITAPDGSVSKGYVNADKTWERRLPDGTVLKGTFEWKDETTACFTQTSPPPKPGTAPNCSKIDAHNVGDTWTTRDDKGGVTKYTATAGR